MDQPLIAVRIKDGIFVGNVTAAHDEDFLTMNKCTHVINCAGSEVRDLFQGSSIEYLTFPWKDTNSSVCTTVMFDSADRNVESAVRFIDKALEAGECVLIHSYFGVSRSCALAAAYLMTKYGWAVDNTLQFLAMAHQDMAIKPYFLRQLRTFAKRHEVAVDVFDTRVDDAHFSLDNEQWMLRNTFVNGLVADVQETHDLYRTATAQVKLCEANYKNASRRRRRIAFSDTKQGTGVHSDMTQPLAQPERTHQHVDPTTGAAYVVSRTAPGAPPPQPILSRRGIPNSRKLEADPHSASRGPQVLPLRAEFNTSRQQPAQQDVRSADPHVHSRSQQREQPGAAPATPRESQPQQQQQAGSGTFTLRGYGGSNSSTGGGSSQQQPPQGNLPQRVVPHANDTVSRPSPVAVPNHASAVQSSSSQQQQQSSSGGGGGGGSARTSTSTGAPRVSGGSKVQNPFTVTSSGARKGSPLPKRSTPTSTSSGTAGSAGLRGRGSISHPAVGGGGTSGTSGSRTSSPMGGPARRPVRAASPQVQQPRAGSPVSRGPTAASAAASRGSPTQHGVFNSSVPNANSTVTRYGASSSSNARGAPISAVPSSLNRGGSGTTAGSRGSSPLARRASSPQTQQQPRAGSPMSRTTLTSSGAAGRNSPHRLAEQYLSGAQPASSYGRETHASVLRRESALARR